MKKNKGFTLVELIVSGAVLAILAGMCCAIMGTSASLSTKITNNSKVEQKADFVLTQIENFLKDCDAVIGTTSGNRIMYFSDTGETTRVKRIYRDKKTNILYYQSFDLAGNTKVSEYLCQNVTSFSVTIPDVSATPEKVSVSGTEYDYNKINYILISITLSAGNETYSAKKMISLRNEPFNLYTTASVQVDCSAIKTIMGW